MTNFFRPVMLFDAVAAALFVTLGEGVAAAALLFLWADFLSPYPSFKKNPQKFNFFEMRNLYYNIMVEKFALKAKSFFFWKGNFEGEGKTYSMREAKLIFCAGLLFISFSVYAQNETVFGLEKYSQSLKSEKAKDRLDAIYALSISSETSGEQMLIEAYKSEKDAYMKTQIIEALSVKNSTTSAAFILEATQDANPEIRKSAWNSINEGALASADMAAAIRENFKKEKDVKVKSFALRAFCIDESSSSVKEISAFILNGKEDRQLRIEALKKLYRFSNKEALKEIKSISKSRDKEIAAQALKLLNSK